MNISIFFLCNISLSLLSSLCFCISFQRVFARSPSHRWPLRAFRVASLSGCSRNNDARVPLHIGRWSHFGRTVSVSPASSFRLFSPLFHNPLPFPLSALFLRCHPPRARAVYSVALHNELGTVYTMQIEFPLHSHPTMSYPLYSDVATVGGI